MKIIKNFEVLNSIHGGGPKTRNLYNPLEPLKLGDFYVNFEMTKAEDCMCSNYQHSDISPNMPSNTPCKK